MLLLTSRSLTTALVEAVVHVADDQSSVCSIDAHPLEQGDAVLHPDPSNIGPRRARDVVHADVLEDASGTAPDVQSTCRNAAEGRSLHDGSRPRTDREPQPKAPVRLEGVLAGVIDDQVLEHGRGAKQVDAHAVGRFDGEVVEARIATKHRDAIHRIQHGEVVHARSASEGRRVELDAFVVHRSAASKTTGQVAVPWTVRRPSTTKRTPAPSWTVVHAAMTSSSLTATVVVLESNTVPLHVV